MAVAQEGPAPKDDFESEQALLWGDAMALFAPSSEAEVRYDTVLTKTGLFALTAGLQIHKPFNRAVYVYQFAEPKGVGVEIQYFPLGVMAKVPMFNGAVVFSPGNTLDEQARYTFCDYMRRILADTAFSAELSAEATRQVNSAQGASDARLYPDQIYKDYPGLKNWRQYYELTWETWTKAPEKEAEES